MKYLPLIVISVAAVASLLVGDWAIRTYLISKARDNPIVSPVSGSAAAQTTAATWPRLTELQEYRAAREQVLRENPDLAAEYQELVSENEKQARDLDAAMIKADPKVASILAKIGLLRKNSLPPTPAPLSHDAGGDLK